MEGVIAALWRLTTTRQMVPDRVRQVKEAASRAASGKEAKMAERSNLSNKLKLVVSYRDADDNEKTRQITFKNLKGNADATAVYGAAEALAGLQEDALIRISEVTENVIEG